MHATQHIVFPRLLHFTLQPRAEWMKLIGMPLESPPLHAQLRRRWRWNLDVLLVQHEQRTMKLGARGVIYPWVGVPIRSAVGGVSGACKVAGHVHHPLLETDIPVQLGIQIGKIEETGEV